MKARIRWIAGLSAVALVLVTAASAFGYTGQVTGSLSISVEAGCGEGGSATATLLDADGAPIAGQSVAWSFASTPATSDTIDKSPTITNASGVATTTLTVAAVSGARTIRATSGDVSATAVFTPPCGGVLPNTSTLPAKAPANPVAPVLLVILAFAAGSGLTLRRLASARG